MNAQIGACVKGFSFRKQWKRSAVGPREGHGAVVRMEGVLGGSGGVDDRMWPMGFWENGWRGRGRDLKGRRREEGAGK